MPTVNQVRMHVETGINDEALLRIIDDATTEVTSRFGDDDPVTELVEVRSRRLVLKRAAQSITSVKLLASDGTVSETLDASDYRLRNKRILERLTAGMFSHDWVTEYDAPEWPQFVEVVYVPEEEVGLRDRVVIDLVMLQVQYRGLDAEKVGDYSMTQQDYQKKREQILQGMSNRRGLRIA